MKAIRRYLRISSKKVNLVADLVRGRPAEQAINFLRFTPKHSAKPLMEAIKSAVANAEQNFKQQKKDLYISKIVVNEGSTLKRSRPVSRGRSHPIMKRTSHITVELAVRTDGHERKRVPRRASKATPSVPTTDKKSNMSKKVSTTHVS